MSKRFDIASQSLDLSNLYHDEGNERSHSTMSVIINYNKVSLFILGK